MQLLTIGKNQAGQRLDKFLKKALPNAGTGFLYKMLRKKNITLNGKKAEGKEILAQGDEVKCFFSEETYASLSGAGAAEDTSDYRKAYRSLKDISVLYEDEIGLVGWIKSERILVGSRTLMEKYSVEVPNMEYEEKYTSQGRQVTYLSRAGRLVAMFVTRYTPDAQLKAEMQRAETNGISFLIRTTDYNVTNDLVAKLYDLFYRSIKVLPTGLGNVLREAEDTVEETSRSYLITNGKAASLARAVTGCVKIKHNISLSIIIQLIAVIFGLLVASTLSLYAGVQVMGSLEVLIYALFWGAAAVFAPAVQKP